MGLQAFEELNTAIVKLSLPQGEPDSETKKSHGGRLITDATACPQDITYPTDCKLLYGSIEKSELLIDRLYDKVLHKSKPRTNRKKYRKLFSGIAQSKSPDRIVSIHQPYIRPIVRGKLNSKVESGSKIQVTLMDGFAFLDEFSWDAFNERKHLISSVEKYKERFGYYPETVVADKIYCNRENRKVLKELEIVLKAKPLGRPKAGEQNPVSPGERNPIEGKFGQAKVKYGLNRIMARLDLTSKSWVACIVMVLSLVKLAGRSPLLPVLNGKLLRTSIKNTNMYYSFCVKCVA